MLKPSYQIQSIINKGLPFSGSPGKKIIIAGAGVSGLVAGFELKKAGYEVTIIEGQNRVGGRIQTLRSEFASDLYGEAGAMRIPKSHQLTMRYIDQFNIQVAPFTSFNPNALLYISGKKYRLGDLETSRNIGDFDLIGNEADLSASKMWENSLKPLIDLINSDIELGWDRIRDEYDQYSVREFLELNQWSEGAIERFGLLYNYEALMNSSFLELFREEVGNYYTDMVYIKGGTDRFLVPFANALSPNIWYGTRIVAIDQDEEGVIFHYRNLAGNGSIRGDFAIITIPFPVMRHVEVLKPFSRSKQRAIRQLHYDSSAKIFLQSRRRFWEEDEDIFGGGTITDLAIRNLYYPDHGKETGRGVLLASYTWGEDAQRWGSLTADEKIRQAIEDVGKIHPQIMKTFEGGASKVWHDDEFAGGAFALFDPGQQTLLYDAIKAPEGRIYFAGEHTSLFHAWIQGAIESGLRCALEINSYHR